MNATSTTSTTPTKPVSPRHALLEELIGIVTRHAGEQYLDLSTKLAGALIDATGGDPKLMQARIRAGNKLRNEAYAFLHIATTTLEKVLRKEIAQLAPKAKAGQPKVDGPLTLVPYEVMDHKVALSGVSKPFESLYADQLQTLNVRLAFLLDRDILRNSQNPFRPEVFLVALQEAWVEFNPEPSAAGLIQPFVKPGMFIDLAPLLEDLNLTMQRKGVLPGSVEGFKHRKSDQQDKPAKAAARARDNQAELAQQLRQLFATPEVAGKMADELANTMVGNLDLSIPELPQAALQATTTWVPSTASPAAIVAGAGTPASAKGVTPAAGFVTGAGAGHGVAAGGVTGAPAGVVAAPGVVVMPPDGWAPGPALATGGGGAWVAAAPGQVLNPEMAQQLSQMAATGNRQPLFQYLNQLQHVPFASQGAAQAVAAAGAAAAADTVGPALPMAAGNVIYLPAIKQQMPQGSLSRADESTIDLLSAVFETVFRDQNISQEIRDLIRFLQIPVLKAALRDKDFFFQEAHPARRLIDLLSRMGWEQRKSPDDPLFQAMQRSVDRVGRDYDQELSVFTQAVNELEAQIDAEEKAAATAIAAPIAAALRQEKMAVANQSAKEAVALRLVTGEVVAVVEAFLEQRWVSVLTIAYSIEDEKPGAVGSATRTMDDLIWSVRPKIGAEERKQLIAKLPGLLSALNKWLDVIKWQDSDRLQFFAELAECHASIVRAPVELSPERQLEISMQVAQQDAERRAERQAKVAVAPPAPEPDEDDAVIEVDGLVRGMWLSFEQDDGSVRKVKLAWISPRRTLYIFSTAARQEAFSMSGDVLAQKFRDGLVTVLRADSVVSVALSQALSGTAVNDDNIHTPQSAAG